VTVISQHFVFPSLHLFFFKMSFGMLKNDTTLWETFDSNDNFAYMDADDDCDDDDFDESPNSFIMEIEVNHNHNIDQDDDDDGSLSEESWNLMDQDDVATANDTPLRIRTPPPPEAESNLQHLLMRDSRRTVTPESSHGSSTDEALPSPPSIPNVANIPFTAVVPDMLELQAQYNRTLQRFTKSMMRSDQTRKIIRRTCSADPTNDFFFSQRCQELEQSRKQVYRMLQRTQSAQPYYHREF
jgi:hypothetical protein